MQFFIILIISGFFAGALGGLLGIGGGIVIMPILRLFVGLPPALAAGTCIIAVFLQRWAEVSDIINWVI